MDKTHYSIRDWWPNQLDLRVLHQDAPMTNPMGEEYNYAKEFGYKSVTVCEKPNVLRETSGMMEEEARAAAESNPDSALGKLLAAGEEVDRGGDVIRTGSVGAA